MITGISFHNLIAIYRLLYGKRQYMTIPYMLAGPGCRDYWITLMTLWSPVGVVAP